MSINKVILIGNLGGDPEVRYASSGVAVCNFTMATTRNYKDKQGERKDETEWHRVRCRFDKQSAWQTRPAGKPNSAKHSTTQRHRSRSEADPGVRSACHSWDVSNS